MEPRLGSPEDRRLTLKVFGIIAIQLVLFALFALRPATLLGVGGTSLGYSVGEAEGKCMKLQDDLWTCDVLDSVSSGGTYVVETRSLGCWDAWPDNRPDRSREPARSGCITLVDVLSFGGVPEQFD